MENEFVEIKPSIEKKITSKGANYVFLVSTIAQIIAVLLVILFIAMISLFTDTKQYNKVIEFYSTPILTITTVFFPVLFYLVSRKINILKSLRLNKLKIKYIIPLIAIGLASQYVGSFLNGIVLLLLSSLGKVPSIDVPTPRSINELILMTVIIAIFPAVFEEIFARGLIMRSYEGAGPYKAIFISALLFAIMHYDITNFIFPLFFGLVLGFVVYRTNSIFAGMIIHFLNNAFAMLMMYLNPSTNTEALENLNLAGLIQSIGITAVAALVLFVCLYFLYELSKKDSRENDCEEYVDIEKSCAMDFFHWPNFISIGLLLVSFTATIYTIISGKNS